MTGSLRGFALLALLQVSYPAPHAGPPKSELRVLFVGNSLTYTHDIPGLVSRLGEISGGPRVRVAAVAFADYSLEDHWNRGEALDSIGRGKWDYVVLQQGPSTLPENRRRLVQWSIRFTERIRGAGAQPALFMVWPMNRDFDGVSRSYADAALAVEGTLIPGGEAFHAVLRDHRDIELFASDGFHPSEAGSYLAALVIYGRLTDRSVSGVTLEWPAAGLTAAQAARLQSAADEANRRFRID